MSFSLISIEFDSSSLALLAISWTKKFISSENLTFTTKKMFRVPNLTLPQRNKNLQISKTYSATKLNNFSEIFLNIFYVLRRKAESSV